MLSHTLITYSNLFLRNIDRNDVRIFLESSPLYPTLLSVLHTLLYLKIDAQVGRCDWEYLRHLDSPFLLHIKSGHKENLVIAKWDLKYKCARILNSRNNKWENKRREDIVKYWDGIVIYTTDRPINQHSGRGTLPIISVAICFVLFALFKTNKLNIGVVYYLPLILGLIVSCALFLKSRLTGVSIIDKICHISENSDCSRVEESKYSTVYGFKMDCLALSFFVSQIICLFISYLFGSNNILYSLYLISTVISIPTIAYSIYGQLKVKNICPLCVLVLFCIAIETIIFLSNDKQPININIITLYSFIFIISIFILQNISNSKNKENKLFTESINLLKLKRKKEILLIESIIVQNISTPIIFGQESSSVSVTTFLSPSCSHCRDVAAGLIRLLNNGVKFKWNIILGETSEVDSLVINDWIRRFLTNKEIFFEDLITWSTGHNKMVMQSNQNSIEYKDLVTIRQSFIEQISELSITGFPKIIINDKMLSSIYSTKDLEFLIIDQLNRIS